MRVAIVGAGTMGTRLALRSAAHGCPTTLIARDGARGAAALDDAARESGLDAANVRVGTSLGDAANAELVAEAIPEDLRQKHELYAALDALIGEHVPIASGTSTFVPERLGEGVPRAGRIVVAHMVHPVTLCPVVELIPPEPSDAQALATVEGWLARLEMRTVRLHKPVTGFLINRLQFALVREAAHLVERGVADAADVDAIVELALGPRWSATGPLASVDLGGRTTFAAVARSVVPDLDARDRIPLLDESTASLRTWNDGGIDAARTRRRRIYEAIDAAR